MSGEGSSKMKEEQPERPPKKKVKFRCVGRAVV
jgi:hypothetical protein